MGSCTATSIPDRPGTGPAALPGPTPQFYFAPHQIKKRNADWGPAEVNRRLHASQSRFIAHVAAANPPWMRLVETTGFEAAAPAASATAAADTPRDAGKLPQSGTVREEYANSGRWISQPGQQP